MRKPVLNNLFQLVGVSTNRSLDKQCLTIFGINSGIDFIVKTHQKRFPRYCFQALCLYYITIAVFSYERGATKILSLLNIQQMSVVQQCELFIQMYIHL